VITIISRIASTGEIARTFFRILFMLSPDI
jgi:hypothetical protein